MLLVALFLWAAIGSSSSSTEQLNPNECRSKLPRFSATLELINCRQFRSMYPEYTKLYSLSYQSYLEERKQYYKMKFLATSQLFYKTADVILRCGDVMRNNTEIMSDSRFCGFQESYFVKLQNTTNQLIGDEQPKSFRADLCDNMHKMRITLRKKNEMFSKAIDKINVNKKSFIGKIFKSKDKYADICSYELHILVKYHTLLLNITNIHFMRIYYYLIKKSTTLKKLDDDDDDEESEEEEGDDKSPNNNKQQEESNHVPNLQINPKQLISNWLGRNKLLVGGSIVVLGFAFGYFYGHLRWKPVPPIVSGSNNSTLITQVPNLSEPDSDWSLYLAIGVSILLTVVYCIVRKCRNGQQNNQYNNQKPSTAVSQSRLISGIPPVNYHSQRTKSQWSKFSKIGLIVQNRSKTSPHVSFHNSKTFLSKNRHSVPSRGPIKSQSKHSTVSKKIN